MEQSPSTPPSPVASTPGQRTRSAARGVLLRTMALVFLCVAASSAGQAGEQDATATVGGETVTLQAKGTRSRLFGAVDIYTVGVYASRNVDSVTALRDPQLTRAVRVDVVYDGGMPEKIPSEWWQELVPVLDKEQQQKLRDAFARLSPGDDIWITYAPSKGTLLRAGGRTVLADPGAGLMNAILNLWVGPTPVSSDLRDTLVAGLRRS